MADAKTEFLLGSG